MNHPACLYQAFFHNASDAIFVFDAATHTIIEANAQALLTLPMGPTRSRDWPWIAYFTRRMVRALMLFPGMRMKHASQVMMACSWSRRTVRLPQ